MYIYLHTHTHVYMCIILLLIVHQDGEVVEDLYIPGRNERTVYRGYHTIKYTVEGETVKHSLTP